MAARNVKHLPGFDPPDKMQSSTLKRQPSPDWSKNDLLRLLSYFEGELQARDITIAALKAEKAKQLLYQAKYGRFGLGDPFVALQRDAIGQRDSNFDEAAVKSMYDNQLAQLENLIATQRKAQLKMREQLAGAEKRYHKVCSELEEEKRKHAQDTAQGDDVTYMLEKERERLRQEIDFEKSNSKKLEKDLRRTLAALEEERASAARHKQVALLLLKERKHLIQKLTAEGQRHSQGESTLSDDQLHGEDLAGLEAESRRSLAMEAALEQQLGEFESERASLREGLSQEQARTRELEAQVEALQRQVQSMAARTSLDSIEIKSSVSPQLASQPSPAASSYSSYSPSSVSSSLGAGAYSSGMNPGSVRPSTSFGGASPSAASASGRSVAVIGSNTSAPVIRQVPKVKTVLEGGRIGSSSPEREVIHRLTDSPVRKVQYGAGGGGGYSSSPVDRPGASALSSSPRGEARVVTMGSSGADSTVVVGGSSSAGGGARVNITPGNSATVVTQGGGKISFHVGAPPPIPPNKPNIVPGAGTKPAPPPKVGVMGRGALDSQGGNKTVQIPVNVVTSPASSTSSSPSTSSQSSRESSPIRKTAQPPHPLEKEVPAVVSPNMASAAPGTTSSLEFLGPEMANLQELLASLSTAIDGGTAIPDTQRVTTVQPTKASVTASPRSSSQLK
ncbi:hypothetical protein BaRGS_00034965 [Batillaria attramentaria]|uniref:Cortactin-binding protein-2 N-terminal domain-containing protein n=1 Tax=Batillaria attramentaria TaxID=370345 RepID=A0ABD0JFV3_9CAEN